MTGITKDEMMQMAREAGGVPLIEGGSALLFSTFDIENLYNAILERAAVECDKANESSSALEKICDEMGDYAASSAAGSESWASEKNAQAIRALKINTGD